MGNFSALVPLVVLIPLLGAALALALPNSRRVQGAITITALGAVAALGVAMMLIVDSQGPQVVTVGGWDAPFGITLAVDRLSAILVTTSAIVLIAVLLFSFGQGIADGHEETPVSIFYPSYLVLGAGVFDAFIANDLFNLYVAFEVLLVASYVLLTMGGTAQRIRAGITYIVVSLVSSILFLASIGILYGATGTVSMPQLAERIAQLDPRLQLVLNLMLLIAFGIKAAIFPLSFWLPDSYPTAPAPVTAVFAGLLTKVGIYAILRSQTLLFGNSDINFLLMCVAGVTLVVGILGAISQRDVKRMLSFILVSHIGYLLFGIAIGNIHGYGATVYYIVHHIVVQTTLFLILGIMERVGGTTNLRDLGGLKKASVPLAIMAFIALLNLGGIPPFSGFIGKIGIFKAAAESGKPEAYWLIGVGALVSLLTLYALVRMWSLAFWRPKKQDDEDSRAKDLAHLAPAPDEQEETQERKRVPVLMRGASWGMVVVSLLLTFAAGPLVGYADRAGAVLDDITQQAPWYFNGKGGGK